MNTVIVIAGPTAVGKTKAAIEIAKLFQTEIISADSRQIFKETNIGTAVPSVEDLQQVTHHLVQTKHVYDYYNAWMFEQEALTVVDEIFKTHNVAVLVGGSGLYIDAFCNGIDTIPDIEPELRQRINQQFIDEGIESLRTSLRLLDPDYYAVVDLSNPVRLKRAIEICLQSGQPYSKLRTSTKNSRPFQCIKIALNLPREELYARINARVDQMISDGLEQEVRSLSEYREYMALKTVGYRELFDYFDGKCTREEAIGKIKQNTRKYAKKQITWLKRTNDYAWYSPFALSDIIDYCSHKIS